MKYNKKLLIPPPPRTLFAAAVCFFFLLVFICDKPIKNINPMPMKEWQGCSHTTIPTFTTQVHFPHASDHGSITADPSGTTFSTDISIVITPAGK